MDDMVTLGTRMACSHSNTLQHICGRPTRQQLSPQKRQFQCVLPQHRQASTSHLRFRNHQALAACIPHHISRSPAQPPWASSNTQTRSPTRSRFNSHPASRHQRLPLARPAAIQTRNHSRESWTGPNRARLWSASLAPRVRGRPARISMNLRRSGRVQEEAAAAARSAASTRYSHHQRMPANLPCPAAAARLRRGQA